MQLRRCKKLVVAALVVPNVPDRPIEGNALLIKRRTFTRKLCESQEVMEYEFEFLRGLEGEYEIITLKEYKERLSTYGQITNPDLYDSNVAQGMLVLFNRFKAYFLTQ